MAFHPVCGLTEATFCARRPLPPIETALFAISEIEEVEQSDLSNDEIQFPAASKPPGHLYHDLEMQQRANEIATELIMTTKRIPTKDSVARKLATERDMNIDTVLRRVRKQWK